MSKEKCDIFPKYLSPRVETLIDYPTSGSMLLRHNVIFFCLYMEDKKIYYQERRVTPRVKGSFKEHERAARTFDRLRPSKINWSRVLNCYGRDPDTNLTNADVRTGFRAGSDFLVKANFTFGLRFVEPGTAHVVQTLRVPLLFYLREPDSVRLRHARKDRGYFPHRTLQFYDRRILLPSKRYRVPPGTLYVLFSTQKNFFRFDVVGEDCRLGFETEDPVAERVVRMPGMYDVPVKTPYVEDDPCEETLNPDGVRDLNLRSFLERQGFAEARTANQETPNPEVDPEVQTFDPETPNPDVRTFDPETQTVNPDVRTFDPETLNPEVDPETLNPDLFFYYHSLTVP